MLQALFQHLKMSSDMKKVILFCLNIFFFTSQEITVEKYHRCFILKNTFAGVCVCHMLYFS